MKKAWAFDVWLGQQSGGTAFQLYGLWQIVKALSISVSPSPTCRWKECRKLNNYLRQDSVDNKSIVVLFWRNVSISFNVYSCCLSLNGERSESCCWFLCFPADSHLLRSSSRQECNQMHYLFVLCDWSPHYGPTAVDWAEPSFRLHHHILLFFLFLLHLHAVFHVYENFTGLKFCDV